MIRHISIQFTTVCVCHRNGCKPPYIAQTVLQHFVHHQNLEYLFCVFFFHQCPPGMKQQVLCFYTKLLAHIRQPLLPHINVHRPVQVRSDIVLISVIFDFWFTFQKALVDAVIALCNCVSFPCGCDMSLSETDPSVWGGVGCSYREWRDPVPLYSLCQAEAGPIPCQLLPWGWLLWHHGEKIDKLNNL